jgi:hypothetical protein
MNANVHFRALLEVSMSEDLLSVLYPKVRKGLRRVWSSKSVN